MAGVLQPPGCIPLRAQAPPPRPQTPLGHRRRCSSTAPCAGLIPPTAPTQRRLRADRHYSIRVTWSAFQTIHGQRMTTDREGPMTKSTAHARHDYTQRPLNLPEPHRPHVRFVRVAPTPPALGPRSRYDEEPNRRSLTRSAIEAGGIRTQGQLRSVNKPSTGSNPAQALAS
jgi:hypothetical protein